MTKIDLITGFLGAGKTTFIRAYAKKLMEQGLKVGILENDLGAVNVDMLLLNDLRGKQCELEMVAGGCDADCHKRRFKTKLISMGMCGYDRILVEPSGIFDMDEFFDVLSESPLENWYSIGNVLTIVDVTLEKSLSKEAEYILASECASAGRLIFSKTDNVEQIQIEKTLGHVQTALVNNRSQRVFRKDEVETKPWNAFGEDEWEKICSAGYVHDDYVKFPVHIENGFTSLYYMYVQGSISEVITHIQSLFEDKEAGVIFRVKGFLKQEDGTFCQINATKDNINTSVIHTGQEVFIVIGEKLNENRIKRYFTCLDNQIAKI